MGKRLNTEAMDKRQIVVDYRPECQPQMPETATKCSINPRGPDET